MVVKIKSNRGHYVRYFSKILHAMLIRARLLVQFSENHQMINELAQLRITTFSKFARTERLPRGSLVIL